MFGFGFWSMTETYMERERERYGADYWNIWITGLDLTILHYTMKISRIFKDKTFLCRQIQEFVIFLVYIFTTIRLD